MTHCLVTGGAGFIGSHLVEALLARGFSVRVLDNLSTGHRKNLAAVQKRIEFIKGDLRDPDAVARAVDNMELVFHLAAVVSVPWSMEHPLETEQVNTAGTLRLLDAAQRAGVRRLVLSSTCAVYGDAPILPKTEAMPPAPKSPYAVSKLAAERYCRVFAGALGLETVILRYFNVFGPRQDPSSPYSGVISIFVDRMRRGQPVTIYGDGEQTRDFVYVSDVAQANLRAALVPDVSGQTFNIGAGQAVTVNRLFHTLRSLLNYPHPPRYEPPRTGDIRHSYADPSLAQTRLGWLAQVTFEEGLRRLVGGDRA